jgi:hypothetical protein
MLAFPYRDCSEYVCGLADDTRLCTKSRSFIGFLGVKMGLSGLEKALKMRPKRSN